MHSMLRIRRRSCFRQCAPCRGACKSILLHKCISHATRSHFVIYSCPITGSIGPRPAVDQPIEIRIERKRAAATQVITAGIVQEDRCWTLTLKHGIVLLLAEVIP